MRGRWVHPDPEPRPRAKQPPAAAPFVPHWRWLAVIALAGACVVAAAAQAGLLQADSGPSPVPVRADTINVGVDDATLDVTFTVPDCRALHRVKADITDDAVSVSVLVVPAACDGPDSRVVSLRLTEDIQGRPVVDAAALVE